MSDAFLAQALYRIKARAQALRIPVLPRLAHRLAMMLAQVSIGDPVVVHPGVYIVHGQVVIDGLVEIQPGAVISPFVTIGLRAGDVRGATIESGSHRDRCQDHRPSEGRRGGHDRRRSRGRRGRRRGVTVVGVPARRLRRPRSRTVPPKPAC